MKINKSIVNSIAGASIILTLLGFISKGIGFIREMVYAQKFGLSKEFDLFLTCIALPNLINTATIYVSQHYFIPTYNKIKEDSIEGSERFFLFTFWQFFLGAIIFSLSLYFVSGYIFNVYLSTFSVEMKNLSIRIFDLLLLTIPFNAGMSIIMSYQQAKFKFITPAVSLIILNILVIIIILLFNNLVEIYVLPVSFIIGYFVAFIYLIFSVRDKIKLKTAFFIKKSLYKSQSKHVPILIIIEVLSLSFVMIDRYYIGKIDPGGIAALNYSFVIYSLPISLLALPLVTTMFSKFSNSPQTLTEDLRSAYRMNFFYMIPFLFIFFFWGNYFLYIFYEGGKFTSNDTILTFETLKIYSISLVFLTTYFLLVKVLYSLNNYNSVLVISIFAFLIKIVLNYSLVGGLNQDGLALSTTLSFFVLCICGLFILFYKFRLISYKVFIFDFLHFFISALTAYSIIIILRSIVELNSGIIIFSELVFFIMIYLFNSYVFRDTEYMLIKHTLNKILV